MTGAGVTPQPCPYCSMGHVGKCPRVKAEEYYPDGTIKRVEFHGQAPITAAGIQEPPHPPFDPHRPGNISTYGWQL